MENMDLSHLTCENGSLGMSVVQLYADWRASGCGFRQECMSPTRRGQLRGAHVLLVQDIHSLPFLFAGL